MGIVLDLWRFLQAQRETRILAYLILENHLHWIAAGPELGRQVGEFKSFAALQIIDELKTRNDQTLLRELALFIKRSNVDQDYQLWQEDSHPQLIETEPKMGQKIEYVHMNPVKRGYVDRPEHWRYSGSRNHLGEPGLLGVCTD